MAEMTGAGVALELEEFAARHAQKAGDGAWQLESPRCLEVHLQNETVRTKVGAMIAYRGNLKFERASAGSVGKMMKAMFTSESGRATNVTGTGVLYLGDASKEVSILKLTDDTLYVNSRDLLAYSEDLQWDITVIKSAGIVAGGLFTFKLWGNGLRGDHHSRRSARARRHADKPAVHRPQRHRRLERGPRSQREGRREPEDVHGPRERRVLADALLGRGLRRGPAVRGGRGQRRQGVGTVSHI